MTIIFEVIGRLIVLQGRTRGGARIGGLIYEIILYDMGKK